MFNLDIFLEASAEIFHDTDQTIKALADKVDDRASLHFKMRLKRFPIVKSFESKINVAQRLRGLMRGERGQPSVATALQQDLDVLPDDVILELAKEIYARGQKLFKNMNQGYKLQPLDAKKSMKSNSGFKSWLNKNDDAIHQVAAMYLNVNPNYFSDIDAYREAIYEIIGSNARRSPPTGGIKTKEYSRAEQVVEAFFKKAVYHMKSRLASPIYRESAIEDIKNAFDSVYGSQYKYFDEFLKFIQRYKL